jgi:L-lactate dehydrogenase
MIISSKGATYYGIGSALARIVNVILQDQRAVMSVCLPALPRFVGGQTTIEKRKLLHIKENVT